MDLFKLTKKFDSVCIAGMCKNAGKTTVLNALIDAYHAEGKNVAVTSIGRDGESNDVVFGNEKPRVFLRRGDFAATAKALLTDCTVTREILCATGIPTPLGEVIIFKARSDGYVQIAGPSIVSQLKQIKRSFFEYGAGSVFFDGALGRKSLCDASVAQAAVLVTGAGLSADMDWVVRETAFAVKLLDLPKAPAFSAILLEGENRTVFLSETQKRTLNGNEAPPSDAEYIFIPGALTGKDESLLDIALKSRLGVIVESGASVLADRGRLENFFLRGGQMFQLDKVEIVAVAVNPVSVFGYGFDAQKFKAETAAAIAKPVFDAGTDL